MTSATEEIRAKAELFGWQDHTPPRERRIGLFVRADQMVDVAYRADGSVLNAILFRFFSINDLQEQERVGDTHKRETVLAWLAA